MLKVVQPTEYLQRFIEKNIRPDGREFLESRDIQVNLGPIKRSQGSATVRIGNTIVVCGIKAEIAVPTALHPKRGYFVPNIDLPALCSSKFKPGPPSDYTQTITTELKELFDTVDIINLDDLCIELNKSVWVLYADIICLNYDGSIMDACLLATMAALGNLTLPKVQMDDGVPKILGNKEPLALQRVVLSSTFATFKGKLLLDPTSDELDVCDSQFSIYIDHSGVLCGQTKRGGKAISRQDVATCMNAAKQRIPSFLALINI